MLTRSGAFIAGAAVKTVPHVGGGGFRERTRVSSLHFTLNVLIRLRDLRSWGFYRKFCIFP